MQEIFQEIEKLEKKEVVVEQQIVERERYFEMTLLITLFYI